MIITTLVFLIIIWFVYKSYIVRKYPPGPFPLPIIGNLHLLRKDIHLAMDRLSKEYGTMFTLWMADKPFSVITDYDLAKKVCITKRYADRLPLYVGDVVYSRGSKDIIMGDYSDSLILHRKLAQSAFQMFGDEMESLEARVLDNLQTFFKTCNQHIGDAKFQIFHDVEHTFFNVMSTIVLGEKIRKDCDRFLKIRDAVFYMMQSGVTLSMVNFYPVLRYLPNPELTKMIKVIQERDDVLQNLVSKIEKDYDMGNKPSNYIEALLRSKMENSDAENNNFENGKKQMTNFTRDHLEMNVFDMFLAGVETVAVSATWSILFLVKWPEVQEKCHQHLDRVKGRKTDDGIRMPVGLEDKQHLPYFMAVIYETLRLASTLPFGVFHKARENTTLNGFTIEKGKFQIENLKFFIPASHKNEAYAVSAKKQTRPISLQDNFNISFKKLSVALCKKISKSSLSNIVLNSKLFYKHIIGGTPANLGQDLSKAFTICPKIFEIFKPLYLQ